MPSFKQVKCEPNWFGGMEASARARGSGVQWSPGLESRGFFQKGLFAIFQEWPHGTVEWAWTSRLDAVEPWSLHGSGERLYTHLFPAPWSVASYQQLESGVVGGFTPWGQANTAKLYLYFLQRGCQTLTNILLDVGAKLWLATVNMIMGNSLHFPEPQFPDY